MALFQKARPVCPLSNHLSLSPSLSHTHFSSPYSTFYPPHSHRHALSHSHFESSVGVGTSFRWSSFQSGAVFAKNLWNFFFTKTLNEKNIVAFFAFRLENRTRTMNKMPTTSGVVAPVPLNPTNSLATHLRDLYQLQAGSGHMPPGFSAAMPPSAGHLSALSALSLQHRQLLELQQRYLTASRLAAVAASAGSNGIGVHQAGGGPPPPPLTSISAHQPSIIPPSRIQNSTSAGKSTRHRAQLYGFDSRR